MGDGLFAVNGGDGSPNGGGGGSGGRLVVNYLKSYLSSSYPDQSHNWYGRSQIKGGRSGAVTFQRSNPKAGEDGTVFHSKCFPGYSGVFCQACPVGTFKYDYSYGACLPCKNKPESSYYNKEAETSSMCSYECNSYLENSFTNKDCLDLA